MATYTNYKNLQVWQLAVDFTQSVYEHTKDFPKHELYGLANQLRRSAISVASNLAEGSTRNSDKDFVRFVNIAKASLAEVETQLIIAHRLSYISDATLDQMQKDIVAIDKMLFSLRRALNERILKEVQAAKQVADA